MGPKTVKTTPEIAEKIKSRRLELNLTIEEAATHAGIGTKTWSRYEAGESIRADKVKGVCKALKIASLPILVDDENDDYEYDVSYRDCSAWSEAFCAAHGEAAAASLAIGCEILLDEIDQDLEELATLPRGTHLGQLPISIIMSFLPRQFLMRYDYEFLFEFRASVSRISGSARVNRFEAAHTVMEEIALLAILHESESLMESHVLPYLEDKLEEKRSAIESTEFEANDELDEAIEDEEFLLNNWDQWVYDVLGDDDVGMYLFSTFCLTPEHPYHFDRWKEPQFYIDESDNPVTRCPDPDMIHMI